MPGFEVKTILVPSDFSASSDEALAVAMDMARVFRATIEIIHVFVPPIYVLPPPIDVVTLPLDTTRILAQIDASLVERGERVRAAGVECRTATLTGNPHQEIVRHAEEERIDLIVMGTHGRSGLEHVILGSVAERVVHKSKSPVLVVPSPERRRGKSAK